MFERCSTASCASTSGLSSVSTAGTLSNCSIATTDNLSGLSCTKDESTYSSVGKLGSHCLAPTQRLSENRCNDFINQNTNDCKLRTSARPVIGLLEVASTALG